MKRKKKHKKSNGQPPTKPESSSNFYEEMRKLREQRKEEQDREKRTAMAKQHAAAMAEFKKWRDDLKWLIDNKSKVNVLSTGQAQYLLPPELVRLVWQTTIKQRILAEREKNPENAAARAIESLRDEMGALAAQYRKVTEADAKEGVSDNESEDRGVDPADGGSIEQAQSAR